MFSLAARRGVFATVCGGVGVAHRFLHTATAVHAARTVAQQTAPKANNKKNNNNNASSTSSTSSPLPVDSNCFYQFYLYRYPPSFFPKVPILQRDDSSHPFLPTEPTYAARPSTAIKQNKNKEGETGIDGDDQRHLLLKVTRFVNGRSASSSLVFDLSDPIHALTATLTSMMAPHMTVDAIRIDRGWLRGLFGSRYVTVDSDAPMRSLLSRGPVSIEYTLHDGVNIDQHGRLTIASDSTSTSISNTSSASLPSLAFNSSESIKLGEAGVLQLQSRFIALALFLVLAMASNIYFSTHTNMDRKELERWHLSEMERKEVIRLQLLHEKREAKRRAAYEKAGRSMEEEDGEEGQENMPAEEDTAASA